MVDGEVSQGQVDHNEDVQHSVPFLLPCDEKLSDARHTPVVHNEFYHVYIFKLKEKNCEPTSISISLLDLSIYNQKQIYLQLAL